MKKSNLDMSLTEITEVGIGSDDVVKIGGEEMITEVLKYIAESDAFAFIPIQLADTTDEQFSVATRVKMYDRFDGDADMLKGFYFSALGALFASLCDYYPVEEVINYITSVVQNTKQVSDVRH